MKSNSNARNTKIRASKPTNLRAVPEPTPVPSPMPDAVRDLDHTLNAVSDATDIITTATRKIRACLLELDNRVMHDAKGTPEQRALAEAFHRLREIEESAGYLDLEVLRHGDFFDEHEVQS